MATILQHLQTLFFASNDSELVSHATLVLLVMQCAFYLFSYFSVTPAPYGRYSRAKNFTVHPTIGWLLQEIPAFAVPTVIFLFSSCSAPFVNKVLISCFMSHYFFRSLVYPWQLKNASRSPFYIVAAAFIFCLWNGFLQGYYLICLAKYPDKYYQNLNFILGISLFSVGFAINIHSDNTLSHLRKPGETGYKIPQGGFFKYVSCANYFGEIVEWLGYAIASCSFPAIFFAVQTALFLGLRAMNHHKFYKEKFRNYPKSRKAVIPFIF